MAGNSKQAKGDEKKTKVDWSCRNCTKGATKALRCKGHLNYASSDLCRECGEHKKDVHLCAYADLGFKLKTFNDRGGQDVAKGAGKGKDKKGKDSPGNNAGKGAAGNRQMMELQKI